MCPRDFYLQGEAPAHLTGELASRSTRPDFIPGPPLDTEKKEDKSTKLLGESAPSSESDSPASLDETQGSGTTSSSPSADPKSLSSEEMSVVDLRNYLVEHLGYGDEEVLKLKTREMRKLVAADRGM